MAKQAMLPDNSPLRDQGGAICPGIEWKLHGGRSRSTDLRCRGTIASHEPRPRHGIYSRTKCAEWVAGRSGCRPWNCSRDLGSYSGRSRWSFCSPNGLRSCFLGRQVGWSYLLFLGCKMILSTRQHLNPAGRSATPPTSTNQIFWYGFLTNVLNPKVALFFSRVSASVHQFRYPFESNYFLVPCTCI